MDSMRRRRDMRVTRTTTRAPSPAYLVIPNASLPNCAMEMSASAHPGGVVAMALRSRIRSRVRTQLLKLRMFREVHDILLRQPNHKLDESFILETIILNMPEENYEKLFDTFLAWARFGDLFDYDEDGKTLSLPD